MVPVNASRGCVALRRLGFSCAEVGRRVERTRAAVCMWRSGCRRPDYASRVALERVFGIALGSWDERADVSSSTHVNVDGATSAT